MSGKSPLQYAVLALLIFFPLLTLYSLITCVNTTLSERKWPWILFILLGIGRFSVNWTTGAWTVAPLAVQLFSASAFEPLYGPWTLAVSIPLGALLFLLKRPAPALEESQQATNSLPTDQPRDPSR